MNIAAEVTLKPGQTILRFRYTNHKLETETRRVNVIRIWYGTSEYHQGPQWFLSAMDNTRHAVRNFAMRDMTDVVDLTKPEEVTSENSPT